MKKSPRNDETSSESQKEALKSRAKEEFVIQQGSGLGVLDEPVPAFNKAPCEKVLEGQNNTFIVLGRDRPGSQLASVKPSTQKARGPYGPRGFHGAGAIDIVVGLSLIHI